MVTCKRTTLTLPMVSFACLYVYLLLVTDPTLRGMIFRCITGWRCRRGSKILRVGSIFNVCSTLANRRPKRKASMTWLRVHCGHQLRCAVDKTVRTGNDHAKNYALKERTSDDVFESVKVGGELTITGPFYRKKNFCENSSENRRAKLTISTIAN